MTVYVDSMYIPKGGKKWCHLMADSLEELHDFAAKIGLKREWLHVDHYDVTEGMRVKAIQAGAIEATSEELIKIRRLIRRGIKV